MYCFSNSQYFHCLQNLEFNRLIYLKKTGVILCMCLAIKGALSSGCFSDVLFGFFSEGQEIWNTMFIIMEICVACSLFFQSWRNVIACCTVNLILAFIQQRVSLMTQHALAMLFEENQIIVLASSFPCCILLSKKLVHKSPCHKIIAG